MTVLHCIKELSLSIFSKKITRITDALGREVHEEAGKVLWYIYDDGSVEKRFRILE